jgi:hypothetical protein
LEGFTVEDRKDKSASHQLNVKLAGRLPGSIRTRFDEPFTMSQGRYDVVIRFLSDKGVRCRYSFFVQGTAQGSAWETTGDGNGWTNQTIRDVLIRLGDEIRVDATGAGGRLDFVELALPNQMPFRINEKFLINSPTE